MPDDAEQPGHPNDSGFTWAAEVGALRTDHLKDNERLRASVTLGTIDAALIPEGFGVVRVGGDLVLATNDVTDVQNLLDPARTHLSSLRLSKVSTGEIADMYGAQIDQTYSEADANRFRVQSASMAPATDMVQPRDPAAGSDTMIVPFTGSGTAENAFTYIPMFVHRSHRDESANVLLAFTREAAGRQDGQRLSFNSIDFELVTAGPDNPQAVTINASAGLYVPRPFADIDADIQADKAIAAFEHEYHYACTQDPGTQIDRVEWAKNHAVPRLRKAQVLFGHAQTLLTDSQ